MVLGIRILAPTPTPPPNLGEGPSATGVFRRFYRLKTPGNAVPPSGEGGKQGGWEPLITVE
jgi:hypothetical protein